MDEVVVTLRYTDSVPTPPMVTEASLREAAPPLGVVVFAAPPHQEYERAMGLVIPSDSIST